MGLLDTMIKTAATKAIIHASGDAAATVITSAVEAKGQAARPELQKIAVPRAASEYEGMDVADVKAELHAYGFTNISLLPKRDLINGWLTKDGSVERITIAGKEDFRKKAKFKAYERVIIQYHTFKNRK